MAAGQKGAFSAIRGALAAIGDTEPCFSHGVGVTSSVYILGSAFLLSSPWWQAFAQALLEWSPLLYGSDVHKDAVTSHCHGCGLQGPFR